MIKLKDLITESIERDVESAGKKAGIRFKKISHDISTNKFRNPEGDMSKFGSDKERVRMNSWLADAGGGTGVVPAYTVDLNAWVNPDQSTFVDPVVVEEDPWRKRIFSR